MNAKKVILTAITLIFMGGSLAAAQEILFLTPDEVKAKLTRNSPLPSIYLGAFGNRKIKDELCRLAEQQIKKHRNYTAYANAAIVYTTDSENGLIPHDITKQDMSSARKYATRALAIRPKSVNMYVLRGLAVERFLNIDLLLQTSLYEDRVSPTVRHNKQLSLKLIEDYEKALRLNPQLRLHAVLENFHRALGNTQRADFYKAYLELENEKEILRQKQAQRRVKHELYKKQNQQNRQKQPAAK